MNIILFQKLEICFQIRAKVLTSTSNEGSGIALVWHDPDIYVNIQEIASPQYILGISEDKTAPGTLVVSWNDTNAVGQKWLLISYK